MERDPEKARAWRQRSKPLRRESAKRRRERAARAAMRAEVIERDGHSCAAAALADIIGPCRFYPPGRPGLEVDEKAARGVVPGSHLRAELGQALCPFHHDWRHANPAEASRLGLRLHSWEVEG